MKEKIKAVLGVLTIFLGFSVIVVGIYVVNEVAEKQHKQNKEERKKCQAACLPHDGWVNSDRCICDLTKKYMPMEN